MKAIFKGYINIDQNAVFSVGKKYGGVIISELFFELKDGLSAERFVIGSEYNIDGLCK